VTSARDNSSRTTSASGSCSLIESFERATLEHALPPSTPSYLHPRSLIAPDDLIAKFFRERRSRAPFHAEVKRDGSRSSRSAIYRFRIRPCPNTLPSRAESCQGREAERKNSLLSRAFCYLLCAFLICERQTKASKSGESERCGYRLRFTALPVAILSSDRNRAR